MQGALQDQLLSLAVSIAVYLPRSHARSCSIYAVQNAWGRLDGCYVHGCPHAIVICKHGCLTVMSPDYRLRACGGMMQR